MDYFYIIVLSVAVVILILLLTFLGISLSKQNSSGVGGAWPPVENTCPDYWKLDPSDSRYCVIPKKDPLNPGSAPRNTGSMYNSKGNIDPNFVKSSGYDNNAMRINFNDQYYTVCNKKTWAKTWGILWDGYSNYSGQC
jgi:hypothetical protein